MIGFVYFLLFILLTVGFTCLMYPMLEHLYDELHRWLGISPTRESDARSSNDSAPVERPKSTASPTNPFTVADD